MSSQSGFRFRINQSKHVLFKVSVYLYVPSWFHKLISVKLDYVYPFTPVHVGKGLLEIQVCQIIIEIQNMYKIEFWV